jgi:hypothetical protein
VRAKAGLNRSILGMAWGKAEHMFGYKCPMHGGGTAREARLPPVPHREPLPAMPAR